MDAKTCGKAGGQWDSKKKVCDFGWKKRKFETWVTDGNKLFIYDAKDRLVGKFMMNHVVNEFLEDRGFKYSEE